MRLNPEPIRPLNLEDVTQNHREFSQGAAQFPSLQTRKCAAQKCTEMHNLSCKQVDKTLRTEHKLLSWRMTWRLPFLPKTCLKSWTTQYPQLAMTTSCLLQADLCDRQLPGAHGEGW